MSAQARLPQFYGIDRNPAAIIRARETLNTQELSAFALMFPGTLSQFRRAIPISPTMVCINGTHDYAVVWAYLQNLTEMVAPGIPVLCCDYAVSGVARAVNEWRASGHYKAAGKFGDSALLVATDCCGRGERGEIKRPMALPQKTFDEVRQSLLNEPLHAEGASACEVLTQRVAEATAPRDLPHFTRIRFQIPTSPADGPMKNRKQKNFLRVFPTEGHGRRYPSSRQATTTGGL